MFESKNLSSWLYTKHYVITLVLESRNMNNDWKQTIKNLMYLFTVSLERT